MEFIHQEKSLLSELMNKNSESTDSTVNNALQKQSQFYDSLNKQFEIRPPEKSPMQNSFPKLAPTVLNGQPKENTDPKESNELPKTAEQPVEDPTPAPAAAPTAGPTAVPTSIPASVEQTTSVVHVKILMSGSWLCLFIAVKWLNHYTRFHIKHDKRIESVFDMVFKLIKYVLKRLKLPLSTEKSFVEQV